MGNAKIAAIVKVMKNSRTKSKSFISKKPQAGLSPSSISKVKTVILI